MSIAFDCWSGIIIGGVRYIIVEKICYREQKGSDTWTEYGLTLEEDKDSEARMWLSISEDGAECTLSTPVARVVPAKSYRLIDTGIEVVTSALGDTEASYGDCATYEQYEIDDNQYFFLEDWDGSKYGSRGVKIDAHIIQTFDPGPKKRRGYFTKKQKAIITKILSSTSAWGVAILFFVIFSDIDLDIDTVHSLRRTFGFPYALHERLSDAPYYTEEPAEGDTQVYRASIDKNAAALDLIEGLDGYVDEIAESDTDAPQQLIFLRAKAETLQISDDGEGKARIVVSHAPLPADRVASVTARTLGHYAETVRGWSETGRRGVVEPGPNEGSLPLPRSIYAPPPKTPPAAPAAHASTAAPSDAAAAQDKSSIMTRAEWIEKMQAASEGTAVKPSLHLVH
ncbi:DUF4178 domain-containing protein [uncultured Selenomonas sp.]|uniref:DUF4178 domain-containing protein n=1 Tax=uncultured Selenomonas sp. TaxID=159275 RepID=UPI0028EA67E0|nr:DUF4178 domain-containing protein [uncultured Selenomonas sp.]